MEKPAFAMFAQFIMKDHRISDLVYVIGVITIEVLLFEAFGNLSHCQEYCLQHYANVFNKISIK